MDKDIDVQFLCKDCSRYNLCEYYHKRKKNSSICKYFHLDEQIMFDKMQNLCDEIALNGNEIGKRISEDGCIASFIYLLDGYYYIMNKRMNEWQSLIQVHDL